LILASYLSNAVYDEAKEKVEQEQNDHYKETKLSPAAVGQVNDGPNQICEALCHFETLPRQEMVVASYEDHRAC
jgi:hypothetical protein